MTVVVVTGGRDFRDWPKFWRAMDHWHARLGITTVVQGGQVTLDPAENHLPYEQRKKWGADHFAKRWAEKRGIECIEEPADWKKHGLSAGPIRNGVMLKRHKPERVIAFEGKKGTADCVGQARGYGIRVIEVV